MGIAQLTYYEFEQKVRRTVEGVAPNLFKAAYWESNCGFAKLTTTNKEDVAILYTGNDSVIDDDVPYQNHGAQRNYSLDEASATLAAQAVVDCMRGHVKDPRG